MLYATLYTITELTFKKMHAIHFKNVNFMKKETLYAIKKFNFTKIQRYKI